MTGSTRAAQERRRALGAPAFFSLRECDKIAELTPLFVRAPACPLCRFTHALRPAPREHQRPRPWLASSSSLCTHTDGRRVRPPAVGCRRRRCRPAVVHLLLLPPRPPARTSIPGRPPACAVATYHGPHAHARRRRCRPCRPAPPENLRGQRADARSAGRGDRPPARRLWVHTGDGEQDEAQCALATGMMSKLASAGQGRRCKKRERERERAGAVS